MLHSSVISLLVLHSSVISPDLPGKFRLSNNRCNKSVTSYIEPPYFLITCYITLIYMYTHTSGVCYTTVTVKV